MKELSDGHDIFVSCKGRSQLSVAIFIALRNHLGARKSLIYKKKCKKCRTLNQPILLVTFFRDIYERTYLKTIARGRDSAKKYIYDTSTCRMKFIQNASDRTMSQHSNARSRKCFELFFASVRFWKVQNLRKNMCKAIYIQLKI